MKMFVGIFLFYKTKKKYKMKIKTASSLYVKLNNAFFQHLKFASKFYIQKKNKDHKNHIHKKR